ncbi:hypothetical protein Lal_00032209 [Lupinus albus]|nr:hypothetical protein Lal_00032209 [Lupinus albus]
MSFTSVSGFDFDNIVAKDLSDRVSYLPKQLAYLLSDVERSLPLGLRCDLTRYLILLLNRKVWVEDPDIAWVDGEVTEIDGRNAKIITTNGKTVIFGTKDILGITSGGCVLKSYFQFRFLVVSPSGVELPSGIVSPTGVVSPSGVELPLGVVSPLGFELPSGIVSPSGVVSLSQVKLPSGIVSPSGVVPPSGVEFPSSIELELSQLDPHEEQEKKMKNISLKEKIDKYDSLED